MTAGRIIGLGQPFAGDDAVGLAVVAHLRARPFADIELCEGVDATEVIALVADCTRVVLVDAMIGARAGQVRQVAIQELDDTIPFRSSSHGFGLRQAIALAEALSPGADQRPRVQLVGIGIATATHGGSRLSPAVGAAIPAAAALAVALVRNVRRPGG